MSTVLPRVDNSLGGNRFTVTASSGVASHAMAGGHSQQLVGLPRPVRGLALTILTNDSITGTYLAQGETRLTLRQVAPHEQHRAVQGAAASKIRPAI